jgi:hypothetical protein
MAQRRHKSGVYLTKKRGRDSGESLFVGHPQAFNERGFDVHPFEHACDLDTSAMHDNERLFRRGEYSLRRARRRFQENASNFHDGVHVFSPAA